MWLWTTETRVFWLWNGEWGRRLGHWPPGCSPASPGEGSRLSPSLTEATAQRWPAEPQWAFCKGGWSLPSLSLGIRSSLR